MTLVDTTTGEIIEVRAIPVDKIDEGPAVREHLIDWAHVAALAENVDHLPNIMVRVRGDRWQLIDGRHRLVAHRDTKRPTITAEVYDLDDREMTLMAVEANILHGRPLSLAERKANAEKVLTIAPDLSNREIARRCGLDHKTVGKLRPEPGGENPHLNDRRTGRDGKSYPAQPKREPAPAEADKNVADGGVPASESDGVGPFMPDSSPAPSATHPAAGEIPAGPDGEEGRHGHDDPSSPNPKTKTDSPEERRARELQHVARDLKRVCDFFAQWDPQAIHALNDPATSEQVGLMLRVALDWWKQWGQTAPKGLRSIPGGRNR